MFRSESIEDMEDRLRANACGSRGNLEVRIGAPEEFTVEVSFERARNLKALRHWMPRALVKRWQ